MTVGRWVFALIGLMSGPALAAGATPSIAIVAASGRSEWSATYRFAKPAKVLVFARSPDRSRTTTWHPPAGFQIASDARGEFVRRTDGAAFRSVTLKMAPAYRSLPMDYAPFSPMGDGGMIFHSGRFFACADTCADDAKWRITFSPPPGANVAFDPVVRRGTVAWTDMGEGRSVYVGAGKPVASADTIAIVDGAVPARIRTQLDADLPRFLHFFAGKLGALPARPMLFVSYDAAHSGGGWGRQGGTLPGQVFVHFYGNHWDGEMAKPGFGFDLAAHLAHEAAHFYQRDRYEPSDNDAWMHEGGAEAMAVLAVRAVTPEHAGAAAEKVAKARVACATSTATKSLREAIAGGDYNAAYTCGLGINLALDAAVRATQPASDGLFAVWRAILAAPAGKMPRFFAAVRATAGACVADAIERAVSTPGAANGDGVAACYKSGST